MTDLLDRVPPSDLAAERAVIAALFIKPDAMDVVAEIITPDAFHDDAHRRIFGSMARLFNAGGKVDIALVANGLKERGQLEQIGGVAFLAKLTDAAPNAHHAKYYATIIRKHEQRRTAINQATEILQAAHDERSDPKELSSRLQAASDEVEGDTKENAAVDASTAVVRAYQKADAIRTGQQKGGLKIGLQSFDTLIGGIFQNELTILAARPSVGKTALALQAAVAMARNGEPVFFASLEMSYVELMARALFATADVDSAKLRTGRLSQEDMGALAEAVATFDEMPLFIDDRSDVSASGVRRAARRIKREHGLSAVFVDYLTLLKPDATEDRKDRRLQVGGDVKRLRGLARELGCAVVCLAQLNRKAAEKGDPPKLSHLKESGDIEQDADAVLFIHRPEVDQPKEHDLRGKAWLIVAKNRHGPITDFGLIYEPSATRFRENLPEPTAFDFNQGQDDGIF